MKQSIYKLLGKDRFPIASYVSPQREYKEGKIKYPCRITQEAYNLLSSAGVNIFYGHSEVAGIHDSDVFKALDCALKANAGYLPRFSASFEYCSLGTSLPDYRLLTKAKKQALDDCFARQLERFCNHPAFFGVSFRDEPGSEMFAGIAAAKKVFDKVCGDKLFYVNMFPYMVTEKMYQFAGDIGEPTRKEFRDEIKSIDKYRVFVREYIDTVNPEIFSYDAYPFRTLGEGAESGIHEVLYDLPSFLAQNEKKCGIPYWMFMQEGGNWEGNPSVRVPTSGEHRLQYSVALGMGAKGIQLFPCCYPNDWMHDKNAIAGLLDRNNKTTDMFSYFKRESRQVQAAGAMLLDAEWQGVLVSGKFFGLLPDKSILDKILWNECIFQGALPGSNNYVLKSFGQIQSIDATSQAIAGCFIKDGKEMYYVFNNSSVVSANITLNFISDTSVSVIRNGVVEKLTGKSIIFKSLEPGEGVLVF